MRLSYGLSLRSYKELNGLYKSVVWTLFILSLEID